MRSQQAILFFVRDERLEGRIKPLPRRHTPPLGYREVNRAISARTARLRERIDLVLTVGDKGSDIDADHFLRQHGNTFGERIANAVEETFALGYEQVVVIGNDSPDITSEDILEGFRLLERGEKASAAPTHDGGAFLIGLNRQAYRREEFLNLSWQTPHLFNDLCSRLSAAPLPVIRPDYDSWQSPEAEIALGRLLGIALHIAVVSKTRSFHILPTNHKALTRSFLPAPPSSFPIAGMIS